MNAEDLQYILSEGVRLLEQEQGYEGVELRELITFARQRYKVSEDEVRTTIARQQLKRKMATQIVGTSCYVFNL